MVAWLRRRKLVQVLTERIQTVAPEAPIAVQPDVELGESFRTKGIDPPLSFRADLDKPHLEQDPKMARNGRLRQGREGRHQVSGRPLLLREQVEDRPPCRFRYRNEDVHGRNIALGVYNVKLMQGSYGKNCSESNPLDGLNDWFSQVAERQEDQHRPRFLFTPWLLPFLLWLRHPDNELSGLPKGLSRAR